MMNLAAPIGLRAVATAIISEDALVPRESATTQARDAAPAETG